MTNYISSLGVQSTFAITTSTPTVNEGSNISFYITANGYGSGILYWVITGVSADDFSDTGAFTGISGKVVITNNVGQINKTLRADSLTEGAEFLQLELHACETEGTLLATSPSVTINDTSLGTMYTLVIAGGGGGGGSGGASVTQSGGGGGGAGGVVYSTQTAISSDVTYWVSVGTGGAGGAANLTAIAPGASGEDSSLVGSTTSIVAKGGGGGGGYFTSALSTTAGGQNGINGGSGGGASSPFNSAGTFTGTATIGGSATSGQGFSGGSTISTRKNAGGGGGASAPGVGGSAQPYGAGGAGITIPTTATVNGGVPGDLPGIPNGTFFGAFNNSTILAITNTNNRLTIGTQDFTFECWIRITGAPIAPGVATIFGNWTFNDTDWAVCIDSQRKLYWQFYDIQGPFTGTTLQLNTWYHIAVTRSGTLVNQFVNGVLDTTKTMGAVFNFLTQSPYQIGGQNYPNSSDFFYGYISNLRFTIGSVLYPTPFTPAGPLTRTSQGATASQVKLLTLASPQGALTRTSDLSTYYNAIVGTVVIFNNISPFGGQSFAGGGAGWASTALTQSLGGGGLPGQNATPLTGSGGGGGGENVAAGSGAGGVVKIAYVSPQQTFYGGAVVNNGTTVVHTYQQSGFFSTYNTNPTFDIAATINETVPDALAGLIEGNGTIVYNVSTTNYGSGVLGWESLGVDKSSFTDNTTKGLVVITNNAGTFSRPTVNNTVSEIPRVLTMTLKSPDYKVLLDTDTSVTIYDQYTIFPDIYEVTELGSPTTVTFTVTSQGIANGTVVYWTTTGVGITARDFADNVLTGTITIQNNSATIVRQVYADYVTEGTETFVINLKSGSYSGTLLSMSPAVTIGDSATTPPTVTSFNPAQGPTAGGTATPTAAGATYDTTGRIIINGSGFTGITDVIFYDVAKSSGISATFTVLNNAQISAVPPPFTPIDPGYPIVSPEFYQVRVYVVRGATSSSQNNTQINYQYVPPPSLTFTDPTNGQLIEQHVQAFVKGNNFTSVMTTIWDFGGGEPLVPVGLTVGAWTEGYVTPPIRNTASTASVRLYTYGGVSNALSYQYMAKAPDITSFSETAGGRLSGGLYTNGTISGYTATGKLQILGKYFTGATSVKFNGVSTPFTFISATRIDATPPAQTGSSQIDAVVEITTSQGTGYSSYNGLLWRYWAIPVITSWNFETGPYSDTFVIGGTLPTRLRIYGNNILTDTAGRVNYSLNNTTSPIIVDFNPAVPPWRGYHRAEPPTNAFNAGGVYNISLETLGGPSNTLSYYVVGTPSITAQPTTSTGAIGTTAGGQVSLTLGGGFASSSITSVTVGGVNASYTINNSGIMTITIPAGLSAGTQTITITTINGTATSSTFVLGANSISSISVTKGGKVGQAVGGLTGGEQAFISSTGFIVGSNNLITSTSAVLNGITYNGTVGEVWFGNRRASIGSVTSTGVYVTVPTGISAGVVSVTVVRGSLWSKTVSNAVNYTYGNYLLTYVSGIGGGGGGDNGNTSYGGGGGGGGAALGAWKELTLGGTYTISVGAGGAVGQSGTVSSVTSSMLSAAAGSFGSNGTGGASGNGNGGGGVVGTRGGGGGGNSGAGSNGGNGGTGTTSFTTSTDIIPPLLTTTTGNATAIALGAGGGGGVLVSTAATISFGGGGATNQGGGNGGGSTTLTVAQNGVANTGGGGGGGGGSATVAVSDTGAYQGAASKIGPFGTVGTNVNYSTNIWNYPAGAPRYDYTKPVQIAFNGSTAYTTTNLSSSAYWTTDRTGFTDATANRYINMSDGSRGYVVVMQHPSAIQQYAVTAASVGYGISGTTFAIARPLGWFSVIDLTYNGFMRFTNRLPTTLATQNNNYGGFDSMGMWMGGGASGVTYQNPTYIGYKFENFRGTSGDGFSSLADIIVHYEAPGYQWQVKIRDVFRFSPSPYDKPTGYSPGVAQPLSFGTSFIVAWNQNQNTSSTTSVAGANGGSGKVVLSYLSQKGVALNLISNSSGNSTNVAAFSTLTDGVWNSFEYKNSTTAVVAAISTPVVGSDR